MSKLGATPPSPRDGFYGEWPAESDLSDVGEESVHLASSLLGVFESESPVHCPVPQSPQRWSQERIPLKPYSMGWHQVSDDAFGLPCFPPDWPERGILS